MRRVWQQMRVESLSSEELMARARAGDGAAFGVLTEPHRPALRAHCYRLLGSLHEADDALQETLLAAWQGLDGFEGRASLRTWLHRIATHRCSNARRAARRRRAKEWDVPGVVPPEPTQRTEVPWLEPFPDAWLEGVEAAGPDARYEQREAISLAFVSALQRLPPRQLAVLVLRDVVGFEAKEVATLLDTTVESVTSALKRARASMPAPGARPASDEEEAVRARFIAAYERADVDALVALLTSDVLVAMPPLANEYVGRSAARTFFEVLFASGRRFELVPTRANGSLAFGAYLRVPSAHWPAAGLFTAALDGDHIGSLYRFEPRWVEAFGLPSVLAASASVTRA